MNYLTDGRSLLEVLTEEFVRNFGLGGSLIRLVAVRDVRTGDRRLVHGSSLMDLRVVG